MIERCDQDIMSIDRDERTTKNKYYNNNCFLLILLFGGRVLTFLHRSEPTFIQKFNCTLARKWLSVENNPSMRMRKKKHECTYVWMCIMYSTYMYSKFNCISQRFHRAFLRIPLFQIYEFVVEICITGNRHIIHILLGVIALFSNIFYLINFIICNNLFKKYFIYVRM